MTNQREVPGFFPVLMQRHGPVSALLADFCSANPLTELCPCPDGAALDFGTAPGLAPPASPLCQALNSQLSPSASIITITSLAKQAGR